MIIKPTTPKIYTPQDRSCVLDLDARDVRGGKIYDRSGKGNHGAITGAVLKPKNYGIPALKFDGVDDYVDCGNDASLQFQNYITIEAWLKTSVYSDQVIVDKYGSSDHGPLLYILADGNLQFYAYDGDSIINKTSSTFNVIDGEWHHILVTVDNVSGNLIFYVDGESESKPFITIGNWGTSGNLYIGYRNKGGSESYFNGTIDEVRIYNRALSASEISKDFNKLRHSFGI